MPRHSARPRPEHWETIRKSLRASWLTPFHWLEWLWEWIAFVLGNWAFLEVLEYAGKLSILVVVILYFVEAPSRKRQKHYQAWQVINTAQGKGGSGGRIDALQDLNHDRVPLVGVNVAGAFLGGIHLERAPLTRSNFDAADVRNCDLSFANLEYSSLRSANLRDAELRNISMENADLRDADLSGANLAGARLAGANLAGADLRRCDLRDVQWKGITGIHLANVFQVKNAPPEFLDWARQNGAVTIESDDEWSRITTASGH